MAEIAHDFVEQTTKQTHTGDANWTDITGASIADTEFVTGRKYLLVMTCVFDSTNVNQNASVRTLHGTTAFASSEMSMEPRSSPNQYHQYMWFTVWTAVASEGVKMQFKIESGSHTVGADQVTLFSMEISEDLTEDTDWFFNENTTSTSLTSSWSTTNNATRTFTPGVANDHWLVMTRSQITPGSTSNNFESRMERTGEASSTEPLLTIEGEDTTNDRQLHTIMRVFTLGNASNTFTEQSRNDQTSNGTRNYSGLFILNLDKFEDRNDVYTAAEVTLSATDFATQVQTLSMTPTQVGDVWIMGWWAFDAGANVAAKSRLQVDQTDQPGTQTSDAYETSKAHDATDELPLGIQTVENLSAANHDFDLDGSGDGTNAAEDRSIFAVTMQVVGVAAGPATVENEIVLQAVNRANTY